MKKHKNIEYYKISKAGHALFLDTEERVNIVDNWIKRIFKNENCTQYSRGISAVA